MIAGARKDGTPVRKGDRVLAVWAASDKSYGHIVEITGAKRLALSGYVTLQTYTIRCNDGRERPAHAWHIKFAIPPRAVTRHQNQNRRALHERD